MFNAIHLSKSAAVRLSWIAVLLCCWCWPGTAADNTAPVITVMTRNVDNGTDLGYVFAATDQDSYAAGMAKTMAELQASGFQARAALLAEEIKAAAPDLIALQEVTIWRTGPIMQPPATTILYDQLDMLQKELAKRDLHYGVIAIQAEIDAEAPVPSQLIDVRLTDRDVILAKLDSLQSDFDVLNAQTHRYRSVFQLGSPVLGQLSAPSGWISVDVVANGSKFRFVNTHLQSAIAGVPQAQQVQLAQADELIASLFLCGMPVVLAGDFNANAELGPEHTGAAQKFLKAGYVDTWNSLHPNDPGYTWPLFGEDQNYGYTVPNERIDLVFAGGMVQAWLGRSPTVVSAERVGMTAPYTSDHAGVVVKVRLK